MTGQLTTSIVRIIYAQNLTDKDLSVVGTVFQYLVDRVDRFLGVNFIPLEHERVPIVLNGFYGSHAKLSFHHIISECQATFVALVDFHILVHVPEYRSLKQP